MVFRVVFHQFNPDILYLFKFFCHKESKPHFDKTLHTKTNHPCTILILNLNAKSRSSAILIENEYFIYEEDRSC